MDGFQLPDAAWAAILSILLMILSTVMAKAAGQRTRDRERQVKLTEDALQEVMYAQAKAEALDRESRQKVVRDLEYALKKTELMQKALRGDVRAQDEIRQLVRQPEPEYLEYVIPCDNPDFGGRQTVRVPVEPEPQTITAVPCALDVIYEGEIERGRTPEIPDQFARDKAGYCTNCGARLGKWKAHLVPPKQPTCPPRVLEPVEPAYPEIDYAEHLLPHDRTYFNNWNSLMGMPPMFPEPKEENG